MKIQLLGNGYRNQTTIVESVAKVMKQRSFLIAYLILQQLNLWIQKRFWNS
jgi:hypothetical protein